MCVRVLCYLVVKYRKPILLETIHLEDRTVRIDGRPGDPSVRLNGGRQGGGRSIEVCIIKTKLVLIIAGIPFVVYKNYVDETLIVIQ